MPSAPFTQNAAKGTDSQISDHSVRLLLALWFLGGESVNQGELTKRVKLKDETSKDCQKIFSQLEKEGAIQVAGKKVSLTESGKRTLGYGMQSTNLAIEGTIVGSWMAKALLKWIQQTDATIALSATNGNGSVSAISSYEDFKPVALEVFDRLNQDYNMGNMVPVYRIRREIGDRVSRSQFSDWLFEMQSEDLLQLLEESVEDAAPDKIEDSVTTKLGKLRCYVKR